MVNARPYLCGQNNARPSTRPSKSILTVAGWTGRLGAGSAAMMQPPAQAKAGYFWPRFKSGIFGLIACAPRAFVRPASETAWRTREGNPEGGEFRLSNLFAKLQNLEIGFCNIDRH
jgi:hypothetical protein